MSKISLIFVSNKEIMKQLFNDINGRSLDVAFTAETSDESIAKWVEQNMDEVENLGVTFQEIESCCDATLRDDRVIEISGDEDLVFLKIRELRVIGNHADKNGNIS